MNERMERVLEKMRKKGIDQLLVSDPLSIRFLTGITVNPGERLYALLLRTSGKHTIFLNYLYYVSNTGFEEVWFSDMDDQIGVLTRHIDTKRRTRLSISISGTFSYSASGALPELKTVWGSDCVDGVRAVKNAEEIEIMKHSTEINDLVMERAAAYIKEGMTEKQIADFIDAEYLKEGASGVSFDTIVCFGANAADQHHTPSETRTLKAGECILIDMGCVWHGYCSDMTRTFYCKSVDDEQANIHDIVRTAVEKAEAAINREHVSVILMHRQETTSTKKATANTGRSALDTSSDRKTMNMAMSARSIKMWLNLV